MTAPQVSERALREHLAAWLSGSPPRQKTLLIRAQPSWTGAATLDVGSVRVRIAEGVSTLAALDAMRTRGEDEYLAVLTGLNEVQLGSAVVLNVDKQRVTVLDEWNVVPTLFGVRDSVTRPIRELGSWVPPLLVSVKPERGYVPAPGGVLTIDYLLQSLVSALIGLDRAESLATSDALAPLDDPGVRARLAEMGNEANNQLIQAVSRHVDPYLAMAMHAASLKGNVSTIAVGLVVGELWANATAELEPSTVAARVRVENYIGGRPASHAAQRFGEAARLVTQRWLADDNTHAQEVLEQAEALCVDLDWGEGAAASEFLPAGLRFRVGRFATELQSAAADPTEDRSITVDQALRDVERHGAHEMFARSLQTAKMAARLVRWLVRTNIESPNISEALSLFSENDAWAERALGDIWNGDTDSRLAEAYKALAHAVQAARKQQNVSAASQLTGDLVNAGTILGIEHLLHKIVVPLATEKPVLLLVLDGMSIPTAIELAAELPSRGWTEISTEKTRKRGVAIAALPTVTEFSRTSLFAGELLAGNQQIEKTRFASAVNGSVFHKDDLRSEAGHALPPAVISAISNTAQKIVGVVLNTIDDALASADVDSLRWDVQSIANLEAILAQAHTAGRVVILTSDHGHIVERGSELRNIPGAAARWRALSTGEVNLDEILVNGPRVLSEGNSAVIAVDEGIRYASKKAGYHGGASLSELAVPIIVFKPRGMEDPKGWTEAPPQEPVWWNESFRPRVIKSIQTKTVKKPKRVPPAEEAALFDVETDQQPAAELAETDLVIRVLSSEIYATRRNIGGRHPVDDSLAAAILSTLISGGGRAHRNTLAATAGVPAEAMSGLLATFRRVLNIDGYPVIDRDVDGETWLLDEALLREQFELGVNHARS